MTSNVTITPREIPSHTATSTPVIASARGLVKTYGTGDTAVRALAGVDVDFARGELTAIMGPSESGKSTLMHCMAREIGRMRAVGLGRRRTVVGLHLFNAVSAVGGGIALVVGGLGVPTDLLRHTPFESFVVPGLFLAVVVGGSGMLGATALLAHWRRALVTSAAAGAVMVGWILGETLLVEGFSWLQGLYLVTGAIALVASIRLSGAERSHTNQGVLR